MKKLLKTLISLIFTVLMVFVGITATAEDRDEKNEWYEQALNAYNTQDYQTALHYFTLLADAGDPYAQYTTASL